jgi:hypothetical protein
VRFGLLVLFAVIVFWRIGPAPASALAVEALVAGILAIAAFRRREACS